MILLEQSVGYAEFRRLWNDHFRIGLVGPVIGLRLDSHDITWLETGLERVSGLVGLAGGVGSCRVHIFMVFVSIVVAVDVQILLDEQVVITVVKFSVSHKNAVDIALDRT